MTNLEKQLRDLREEPIIFVCFSANLHLLSFFS